VRIVADENIPAVEHFFADLGEVVTLPGRAIATEDLSRADVLLVRSVTPVNQTLLAETPVRFVGSATIGVDHLDTHWLDAQSIPWAAAPGCNADAVGDYVLAVMALAAEEQGRDLSDYSVGIVGAGNVGGRLWQRLIALGLSVKVSDPPRESDGETGFSPLETVLSQDVVCLHTPLTHGGTHPTYHLIDSAVLESLRADQLLISAGRGGVVDNEALLARLRASDGGPTVALDVWENEPGVLLDLACRVWLGTPHIAGYSLEGKLRGTAMIHQALCRSLGLGPQKPLDPVLPEPPPVEPPLSERADRPETWILAAYDPREDAARFRASLKGNDSERAQAFDQLRRHYPVRYEFSRRSLGAPVESTLAAQLRAAGFALSQE